MGIIPKSAITLFYVLLSLSATMCTYDGILRGREEKSQDGKTYLVIEDDNEGACDSLLIDGHPLKYKIGEAIEISPGVHSIECGGKIEFRIREKTIFYFDYWGP